MFKKVFEEVSGKTATTISAADIKDGIFVITNQTISVNNYSDRGDSVALSTSTNSMIINGTTVNEFAESFSELKEEVAIPKKSAPKKSEKTTK